MNLTSRCRPPSALRTSAVTLMGKVPRRHGNQTQSKAFRAHQSRATPSAASGPSIRKHDVVKLPGYAEVLPASGDMRAGVGEVPREPPLGFRLLISLMITAFSSLNCSSPANGMIADRTGALKKIVQALTSSMLYW